MFLRLISDVPKLLLPRVQLSWLLAQPQSLSSSSHATGRAGIWECPKGTSPACTQVVGQDREAGEGELQIIPIPGGITRDGDKETESRDLPLTTCLQQGFVRGEKKSEPAGSPGQVNSSWVVLKTQGKPQIISTNHSQQMCSGSKGERRSLNISGMQGWIGLPV